MQRWFAFLSILALSSCGGRVGESLSSDAGTDVVVAGDVTRGACGVRRGTVVDVSASATPEAIAVDSTHVYWISNDRTLHRAPKQGGLAQDLAQHVTGRALALSATDIVYTTSAYGARMPKGGGESLLLGSLLPFASANSTDIVIHGDTTYVAFFWGLEHEPGWVVRSPADPGLIFEEVARGGATALAGDATSLYASFRNFQGGSIQRIPFDGSPAVTLTVVNGAQEIAIDDDTVYFTAGEPLRLMRVAKGGGAVSVLAKGSGQIALDDTSLYWTDLESMTVRAMPKKGGVPEVLAALDRAPWSIASDPCWVYFGTNRGVLRVAK